MPGHLPPLLDLLVLDVDGTLLAPDGSMPPERAEALARVSSVVTTLFATGKTWPSIAPLARQFGLTGPHLTCNGAALVSLDGGVEVLSSLAPTTVALVLEELHDLGIPAATYLADGTSVARAWSDGFERIGQVGEAPPRIDDAPPGIEVLKILAVISEEEESGHLRKLAQDIARIQRTGPWFLEWNAREASKGTGLELLAQRLGVELASVVAVGDSENDVSMFEVSGWGVAVVSASEVARAAADVHLGDDVAVWFNWIADRSRQP